MSKDISFWNYLNYGCTEVMNLASEILIFIPLGNVKRVLEVVRR